jgi:uncharacterized protein YqjF (DUF2071 family)
MRANCPEVISNEGNAAARRRLLSGRGEPLFLADWDQPVFIHYEVDAAALAREVPFPLDLWEGRAYVTLVAFTIRDLRLRFGGKLGAWLFKPIATHEFLNVRTYVRHRGEPGIFFLSEWLSNALSVRLGPRTFGLPYRSGRMEYHHERKRGGARQISLRRGCLRYEAKVDPDTTFDVCARGSRDEFLLERYTAFTSCAGRHRFFRIWHPPWRVATISVEVSDNRLITSTWPWFSEAKMIGANYSTGARKVWMGWPHRIKASQMRKRSSVLSAMFEWP